MISLYFWCGLFLFSAILFPISLLIWVLTVLFDKRLYLMHQFACLWSTIVLSLNPIWRIKVTGKDKIKKGVTYMMVSNHQSGMDVIVLFKLWAHFKWVAKKSLFYYPFIGWNMWLNRYISLDRKKTGNTRKMMDNVIRNLKSGNSVMVFPEGTRSKDGKLQPFRSGAFHMALLAQTPILPIVISGTSEAIRKGGFMVSKNFNMRAMVLDPIPYDSFKYLSTRELMLSVHNQISEELNKKE